MIPYGARAHQERSKLLGATSGIVAQEGMISRQLEKASRREQLEYIQAAPKKIQSRAGSVTQLTRGQGRAPGEWRKSPSARRARAKSRAAAPWQYRKQRYTRFNFGGAGGVGTFSQKELEQWGGPGSSWGTGSWQTKSFSRTGSTGWDRPRTIGKKGVDKKGTPSSIMSLASRDVKADIATAALRPVLSPLFRYMKPSEAKPHTTGTIAGRAFRSIGRSGLGRAAGSPAARAAFSGAGTIAGRIHPGIGLGLSIAKGIGRVYQGA